MADGARGWAARIGAGLIAAALAAPALLAASAHARATPAPGAAAARPAAQSWSGPHTIDQVAPLTQAFTGGGDCVSLSLCVIAGVDAVVSSTDPGAGPSAWHTTLLPGPVRIVDISCPSAHECIGSFGFNHLSISRDPTGGARAWHTARLPASMAEVNDLDCATEHLCVVVGSGRRLAWSTSPTAGRGAWHTGLVRGAADFLSVSCPSLSLCVAADDAGNLAVSTHPLEGARTWRIVRMRLATTSLGVTCPSTRLCVGSDGGRRLVISTDPAGGRRAWHTVTLIHRGTGDLDVPVCPTASFCLAGNQAGSVYTSSDPAGGARAWHHHRADFKAGLIACAARRACIAGDQGGRIAATTDLPRPTRWRRLATIGGNDIRAVACPSRALCLAGDDGGNVLRAAGARTERWHNTGFARLMRHRYGGGEQVLGLACGTPTTCLATVTSSDDEGEEGQLYAFDPRRIATTLRPVQISLAGLRTPEYLGHLACPARSLCEVTGHLRSGRPVRLSSRDPTDPASWAVRADVPPPRSACPSPTLCLAPAAHGKLNLFAERGGRFVRVQALKVLFPGPVRQVSCDRARTCAAVGPGGVAVSDDPTDARAWRFAASEPLGLTPLSLACAARSSCVAVGLYGKAVSTAPSPTAAPAARSAPTPSMNSPSELHPRQDIASDATVIRITSPSATQAMRSSDCRRSSRSWNAAACAFERYSRWMVNCQPVAASGASRPAARW